MEWIGGCLCGDVRYRASEDPRWAGACHCGRCRKQSGAPYTVGVLFAEDSFEWTSGQPAYYRSSAKVRRGFCARCGSTLTWETVAGGFTVLIGSLDRPEAVQPDSHCYTATKLPWVCLEDGTPQYAEADVTMAWRKS